jgi:GAF domain-containing protein
VRREREPVGIATFGRVAGDPAFSGEEIQFAEALSLQLGVILQNNALLAEANRLAQHEKQINEITTRLRGSLDAQIALETAAESLGLALGDVTVGIRLLGPRDTGPPMAGAVLEAGRERPDE